VTYAKSGLFWFQCFLPSLVIRKSQAGAGKSSLGLLWFLRFIVNVFVVYLPFSYPEPFLRAVRRGALAKSISNWHLIGYNEGYCSNTGYILLPCFYGSGFGFGQSPRRTARKKGSGYENVYLRISS
jgi:hypothetical protein